MPCGRHWIRVTFMGSKKKAKTVGPRRTVWHLCCSWREKEGVNLFLAVLYWLRPTQRKYSCKQLGVFPGRGFFFFGKSVNWDFGGMNCCFPGMPPASCMIGEEGGHCFAPGPSWGWCFLSLILLTCLSVDGFPEEWHLSVCSWRWVLLSAGASRHRYR